MLLLIHTLYYQRCSKVPFIIESYLGPVAQWCSSCSGKPVPNCNRRTRRSYIMD
ncbi:hypothetical protein [Escherichia phage vB_EcoP_EP32B]|nr:hypothetical protein [Escherichia phage vB_EcoP_EP32B]